MANFIGLVYATLKNEGVDTKGMSTDEAVAKYNELQKKDGGKAGEKEGTPAEQRALKNEYKDIPESWKANEKYRNEYLKRLKVKEDKLPDFDYKTQEVKWSIAGAIPSREGIFDTTTLGGYSQYDKDLANKENIIYMTPIEYLEKCGEGFGNDFHTQLKQIEAEPEILNHLYNVIYNKNKRYPMPYIDLNNPSQQEGRHRMYAAAEILGWGKKFPVLAINNSKPKN